MTEQEAAQAALGARQQYGVPATYKVKSAEKRIVELVADNQAVQRELPGPGPARDVVAWVVRLGAGPGWVDFTLEDATGKVVRVLQSRGAVTSEAELQAGVR